MVLFQIFLDLQMDQMQCYIQANSNLVLESDQQIQTQIIHKQSKFQMQLEHYEKVEGKALSLDGKANQLSQMLRGHLPLAMQGLGVVPIFAGYDHRQEAGRLFQYDVTGGRYEERDHAATGSGMLHASTVVKLRYREEMSADDAVDVVVEALFQAADEDSATGGPDPIRGIYPVVATITDEGFQRLDDDLVAERTATLLASLGGSSAAGGAGS